MGLSWGITWLHWSVRHMISVKDLLSSSRSATGTSNGSCSDVLTLTISDWLFHLEGGVSCN